jgi:hypothetical protein
MPAPPPMSSSPSIGDVTDMVKELRAMGALEVHFGMSPDGTSKIEVRFGAQPVTIQLPNGLAMEAPPNEDAPDVDEDLFAAVP